jgi:hypothetical protein
MKISEQTKGTIEGMAAVGCTLDQIAKYLKISPRTLDHWINKPDVRVYYDKARANAIGFVAGKLMELIKQNDKTAIIFYLKAQANWNDQGDMNINITNELSKRESEIMAAIKKVVKDPETLKALGHELGGNEKAPE